MTLNGLVAIIVSAIGNRMWGSGKVPHWSGALVMAIATVIALPALWMWLPVFFGTIYLFRMWPTAPWLDIMSQPTTPQIVVKAIIRGIWIMPHAIVLYLLTDVTAHIGVALWFPIIALVYYLAGKQNKVNPTVISELLTGAFVGLVAVT